MLAEVSDLVSWKIEVDNECSNVVKKPIWKQWTLLSKQEIKPNEKLIIQAATSGGQLSVIAQSPSIGHLDFLVAKSSWKPQDYKYQESEWKPDYSMAIISML